MRMILSTTKYLIRIIYEDGKKEYVTSTGGNSNPEYATQFYSKELAAKEFEFILLGCPYKIRKFEILEINIQWVIAETITHEVKT